MIETFRFLYLQISIFVFPLFLYVFFPQNLFFPSVFRNWMQAKIISKVLFLDVRQLQIYVNIIKISRKSKCRNSWWIKKYQGQSSDFLDKENNASFSTYENKLTEQKNISCVYFIVFTSTTNLDILKQKCFYVAVHLVVRKCVYSPTVVIITYIKGYKILYNNTLK